MKKDIGLKTIQPFLVMENSEFYQHIYEKNGISHFYSITPSVEREVVMVPNGSIDIIFEYGSTRMRAYVLGATVDHYSHYVWHTNTYFGVRLKSGYWPNFFISSNKEIADSKVELNQLMEEKEVFRSLEEKEIFEEQIEEFLRIYYLYYRRKAGDLSKYEIVKRCKALIHESKGLIRVGELEVQVGYTARYINKLFEQEVGCPPKTYCKMVRFQNVLEYMNKNPNAKFVDVATIFGYYDQSQLNKEFRQFTDKTPKEYKKIVNSDKYFRKVIDVPIFTRNIENTSL